MKKPYEAIVFPIRSHQLQGFACLPLSFIQFCEWVVFFLRQGKRREFNSTISARYLSLKSKKSYWTQ
jgi:hypothetical protein